MSISYKDQIFCPLYVIIDKLDIKMCQSQNWLDTLLSDSKPIVYKQKKNSNNKNKDLRAKIY